MEYAFSDELISDLYKDANGFRPGAIYMEYWNIMSNDQKQEEWDGLIREMNWSLQQDMIRANGALIRFEEAVAKIIAVGAGTREAALKWMTESEKFKSDQCVEQFVWQQGFLFTEAGKALVSEMKQLYGIN